VMGRSMTLAKRIIPCLDVDNGRVVKGVNFIDIKDAGCPVEVAKRYNLQGADEIALLDISASNEGRSTTLDIVERIAGEVFIPLTVGGGVASVNDVRKLLISGADKVAINSAAIRNPALVSEAAEHFGRQCIVVAIDAKRTEQGWEIFTHGGRKATGIDAIEWAERAEQLGAGELLVTSMDRDGTKAGFDNELMAQIAKRVRIPIIASGGVGKLEHLVEGIQQGRADAVLAASIFHFGEFSLAEAKQALSDAGIVVRD